jgi:sugar/nucleoside kinase (ribokinase family)
MMTMRATAGVYPDGRTPTVFDASPRDARRYRSRVAELDLLVLGDANPDLLMTGDVVPTFGQAEHVVDAARFLIGGSGAIAACGAARLGLRTAFAGAVGDDVFGRFMLDALSKRGVDTSGCVVTDAAPTGISVILSRGDDRAILTSTGAMRRLRADVIDAALLARARHVHVSSFFLLRELASDLPTLFGRVHADGATTSIDPNWDPSGAWDGGLLELLRATDVFLPNSAEARALTGLDDIDIAAQALAERGAVVVVKFGEGGGLAISGDEVVRRESIATEVVDTTGAGDSFDAGFLAGRLAGWPLERSLALAVACGSLSTRAEGGTAAQPTLDEALTALERRA